MSSANTIAIILRALASSVRLRATHAGLRLRVSSKHRSRSRYKAIVKDSTHNASFNGMKQTTSSTTSFTLLATIFYLRTSQLNSLMKLTFTSKGRVSRYLHLKSQDMIFLDMLSCKTPARFLYYHLKMYVFNTFPHRSYTLHRIGDRLALVMLLSQPSIRCAETSLRCEVRLARLSQSLKSCTTGSPGCQRTHS